eukprot:gene11130-12967_t
MYIDFTGSARGPLWGVNTVEVAYSDNGETYTLQIYPDIVNDDLRNSGKPMHFYIMPNSVRMAKNDQGKYQFHFTKFAGVRTEDANIATQGQEEVAGGVVSFTSTLELPPGVIDSLKDQIAAEIKKNAKLNANPLFQFLAGNPPSFELGFVPIEENQVAVSSLTLNDLSDPAKQPKDDEWLWEMQGQGQGSLDPNGKNACSAMLGQYPAALVESGFKGDNSPLFVHNALKLRFYTPSVKIYVHADYHKIHDAFTSNSKYKDNWTQENIHNAFEENNLWGFCTTKIMYGEAELDDKQKEVYNDMASKAKDTIMENVKKYIFDPQPVALEKAEAAETKSRQLEIQSQSSSSFFGLFKSSQTTYNWKDSDNGYSYALNTNFQAANISMDDVTEIQGPYFKTTVVSGNMKGFFQEISADPKAKDEYFNFVNLGDAFKKIHVIATSRANWPDGQGNGEPLDKLLLSVGYTDASGVVQYRNSGRYYDSLGQKLSTDFAPAIWTKDNKDRVYVFDFAEDDNVPTELRNQIFIKRSVTYKEDERVKVNADNTVIIADQQTSNKQIEVKADLVGHLKVGPVYLSADLNKHMLVEVTFTKSGFQPLTIMFTANNLDQKQFFEIWTSETTGAIKWTYKAKVTYKSFGPLEAVIYEGEEVQMEGSYPNGISISLPKPPDNLLESLTAYKAKSAALELLDA